jgi:hypothetical protein
MQCFRLFIILSLAAFVSPRSLLQAQPLPGEWTAYVSHVRSFQSAHAQGLTYFITEGGLVIYNDATQTSNALSTVNGLSGIAPTALYVTPENSQVFLGYADGRIDFFTEPNQISFLTEIERNTFYTQKRINAITASGNRLFVATEFGIVIYDLATRLPVADVAQFATNPSRLSVTSVTTLDGFIYLTLENNRLYRASLSSPNLRDPQAWAEVSPVPGPSPVILQVAANASALYARSANTVYVFSQGQWAEFEPMKETYDRIYVQDNIVLASRINAVTGARPDGSSFTFFVTGGVSWVTEVNNTFFIPTAFAGILRWENFAVTEISPDGPLNNDCIRIAAGNGDLYVAPTGYDQLLAPSLSFDGIYYFNRNNGGWKNLNNGTGTIPSRVATDFARALFDPETGRAYLGSWGRGIVAMEQGEIVDIYDCLEGLSTLDGACDTNKLGNTRVSGMGLDDNGNLWVSLNLAIAPLQVRTEAGNWVSMPSTRFPANFQSLDLVVDQFGNKWMINRREGLVVYQDNRTVDNFQDDRVVVLRAGVGQGGLPSNTVNDLAVDRDGFVWVATGLGVAVYYDPGSVAAGRVVDANTPFFQGRPLLKDVSVNAITIDGANRKWIGTNAGVFLAGPDGNEIIYQYTTQNSPLLSNEIYDIAVDGQTGEVFIATAGGIVSFQGDATTPVTSCDDVQVWPNPVRPDYSGPIRIQGSGFESRVKITTVSGLLVRELVSQGGTTIWDGTDLRGRRVAPGVYLALIADRNGENACIGKFAVISQ